MARAEVGATGASAWLARRSIRYFFVLLAIFGILIASSVFVPVFLKFAAAGLGVDGVGGIGASRREIVMIDT